MQRVFFIRGDVCLGEGPCVNIPNQTVPMGRALLWLFPGTSCQATLIKSLRDQEPSASAITARADMRPLVFASRIFLHMPALDSLPSIPTILSKAGMFQALVKAV